MRTGPFRRGLSSSRRHIPLWRSRPRWTVAPHHNRQGCPDRYPDSFCPMNPDWGRVGDFLEHWENNKADVSKTFVTTTATWNAKEKLLPLVSTLATGIYLNASAIISSWRTDTFNLLTSPPGHTEHAHNTKNNKIISSPFLMLTLMSLLSLSSLTRVANENKLFAPKYQRYTVFDPSRHLT